IALVLRGVSPALDEKNPQKRSKSRYAIDPGVKAEALARVERLLSRFPVYPELDLLALKEAFVPR
ncbi:MAG: glycine hydroxymethyltransferase, partial [Treponema sp.]|nr:glycine hydroxymethyltransferase [Treponema sp.]